MMLEERLRDIEEEIFSIQSQIALLKKDKLTPSIGLLDALSKLETKKENFKNSIKLWQDFRKVYPTYNR